MAFTVVEYSIDAFAELLEKRSEASRALVSAKLKSKYYEDCFNSVGIKTIVIESPYIDHDYLDDFAAYYVKCFHSYDRFCTRLHFFKESFDSAMFSSFLRDPSSTLGEVLAKSYCGFLVIRPLPRSIIGRTCLELPVRLTREEVQHKAG